MARLIRNLYLVPEHSNTASGGHLRRTEPDGGQSGRNRQDKHLRQSHQTLAQKAHPKAVGRHGGHFDPRTETGPGDTDYYRQSETLKMGEIVVLFVCEKFFSESFV